MPFFIFFNTFVGILNLINFMTDMDGKSLDMNKERVARLKGLFPEVFSEDKIDFQRLRQALGEEIVVKREHYELSWAGKNEARKEVQKQTTATLMPDKDNSIGFDTAQNVFIEGENLEVLRVLQKSYFGKIKMIYIDPPYNTGNDSFVYPDDYSEKQDAYKKRTGITDSKGLLNKQDLWKKNTKENGQFHSVWLSMMYPRLFLSRNLLREDGAIFISIDDAEQTNLKLLCDEIFGAENFVANMIRQNKVGGGHDTALIAIEYDYILVYAKNKAVLKLNQEVLDVENDEKYKLQDEFVAERGKYYLRDLDYKGNYGISLDYPITTPDGNQIYAGGKLGEPNTWRWGKDKFNWGLQSGFIVFKKNQNNWKVYIKQYQFVDNEGNIRERTIPFRALIKFLNGTGSKEITTIFGNSAYFSFPKSTDLLQYLINIVCDKNDIILDYFAGSATTAHAVIKQNLLDGGNRQFICIQLPEELEENSLARKEGYKTIADVSCDRIKKVIARVWADEKNSQKNKGNLGVKIFKLSPSNFKIWQSDLSGKENILNQLFIFKENTINAIFDHQIYEILIKSGGVLTSKIDKISIANHASVYHLVDTAILIVLESISKDLVEIAVKLNIKKVIVLDNLFQNNDSFKTNFSLELKENKIDFQSI
jgi:adenine-specific DNA-methyltransferase